MKQYHTQGQYLSTSVRLMPIPRARAVLIKSFRDTLRCVRKKDCNWLLCIDVSVDSDLSIQIYRFGFINSDLSIRMVRSVQFLIYENQLVFFIIKETSF